jgi:hypothetical protein
VLRRVVEQLTQRDPSHLSCSPRWGCSARSGFNLEHDPEK